MTTTILTGASSGIGAALARELHRRGHRVGLIARRQHLLEELAESLGEGAAWAAADVTDARALEKAVARLEETLGPCELLVAGAGVGHTRSVRRWDTGEVARVVRVNTLGVVHAVGAVLPGMLERGEGHLAAISSLAGWRALPRGAVYSASKSAVTTLLEGLSLELSRSGIAVTAIHPGFVDTPLTEGNRFPMPLMWSAERAARRIADGLERRRARVDFPLPLVVALHLARLLPLWAWRPAIRVLYPGGRRRG